MTESGSQPDLLNMERRVAWLTRLLGIGVLALVGVTWKLWTPQDVFPRVPLLRWAPPDWWDWLSLGLIVIGGLGLGVGPSCRVRHFAATLACGLAIAFLCDQHRLQPWAWQFLILALLVTLADKPLQWHGWQWLTISIYFYSALSKFDADFLQSTGKSFIQVINETFRTSHLSLRLLPQYFFLYPKLAWIFPAGELMCAVLLVSVRRKTYGWIGIVLMHLALIRILGPKGLQHSWGVIVWNVFLIPQAIILFGWDDCVFVMRRFIWQHESVSLPAGPLPTVSHPVLANRIAQTFLTIVLVMPTLTMWGWFDFWLGWAVYVKPYEIAYVIVDAKAFEAMTPQQMKQLGLPPVAWSPNPHSQVRVPVDVGRRSLMSLQAPAYPNIRSSLAVALDLAEHWEDTKIQVRIVRRHRWELRDQMSALLAAHENGTTLSTPEEIHDYCKRFWFNAYPTSMYRRAAREKAMKDDG